jgi:Ca-activated chloride channel family protein
MYHWFRQPDWLWLLLILPILAGLAVGARRARRRALAELGSLHWLVGQSRSWRRLVRGACLAGGLVLVALSAAGPQWGRDWNQSIAPGRDLVVVVDCSRSMLAETPSRLERARDALVDLAETLARRGGHRVALVVAAGKARLVCPLTHDSDFFRDAVAQLADAPFEAELQPTAGTASGTRLGAALQEAVSAHDPRFAGRQDIVLLSDGDDPARDGEWRLGTQAAQAGGIAIHTIGLGDPDHASAILTPHGPLIYDGHEVRTRLEEAPLREIARRTGGTYIPAHTQRVPLGQLYFDAIAGQPQRQASDEAIPLYHLRYALFLLPAFGLWASAWALPDRPRRSTNQGGTP